MRTSFYSDEELKTIGFKSIGKNVLLSQKVSIYSPECISIGNNVRIDDFCILSGNITIGSNIHISAYCALYGRMGITIEDYAGISPRSTIFSAMDDFCGDFLIGPIHPEQFTNVTGGLVTIKRYTQIGSGCIIFPNITLNEGSVCGAMTLVNKDLDPWTINTGIPINKSRTRNKGLLQIINQLEDN